MKDPGSFKIPCTIGSLNFKKALCDLGVSNNLISLSVFWKLGLGEAKPTTISLQMVDRSLTYSRGVIEDILVKVDKFIFLMDFVVLDIEEDKEIPLILGRSFLATGRALIDVHNGNLTLRVNDEEVKFNIYHTMKFPNKVQLCNCIDVIGDCVKRVIHGVLCSDQLEHCLVYSLFRKQTLLTTEVADGYYSIEEDHLASVLALESLPCEERLGGQVDAIVPVSILE